MKKVSLVIAAIFILAMPIRAQPVTESEPSDDVLLERFAQAESEEQQTELIELLQERTSDEVRAALESVAQDRAEPGDLRMQALCGLARSATSESVPLVMEILERDLEERTGLWACAIPLLGEIGDRRAMPLLTKIATLDEAHLIGMDHMAITAISLMAEIGDVPFLETKAHIVPVRTDVIVALARLGEVSSVEILISGLHEGEDQEVISAATAGLMKTGRPALPQLRETYETYPDDVLKGRLSTLIEALE